MCQLQKNETFTLEVARRVKADEVEAVPDGERPLQLVDEIQHPRGANQAPAAIYTKGTAYAVAQRIAPKFGLAGLVPIRIGQPRIADAVMPVFARPL